MSDPLDSNEEVLKEDLLCAPNSDPLPWAGVFAHDGRVEPVVEATVTVDPKLGSVLRPPNPAFCWDCPRPPNPDPVPLLLAKLEKPEPPPACPNFANPDDPPAPAANGLAWAWVGCEGAPQGEALLPNPPAAPNGEAPAPMAEAVPKEGLPNAEAPGVPEEEAAPKGDAAVGLPNTDCG